MIFRSIPFSDVGYKYIYINFTILFSTEKQNI